MQVPMSTEASSLIIEVDNVFPEMEMPASNELIFHGDGCYLCVEVRRFLNASRHINIDDALITFLHQELYHLSHAAFRWILPHYLKFCLASNGINAQEETYFLVFFFSPSAEFKAETYQKLSGLNFEQLKCVVSFFKWCRSNNNWVEIFADIDIAIEFITNYIDIYRREQ